MAEDLYQTLGVTADADERQIKKAYFRLVRKHPPEKDPENFKAIRAAYETLFDEKARKSYDAMANFGEELAELLDKAMERVAEEDWEGAAGPLKRILVLDPNAHAARNQLGLCLACQERFDDAQKVFETLTKKQPEVALYWINLGQVMIEHAKHVAEESIATAKGLMEGARTHLKKAVEIESFNASPYLAIAQSYLELEQYQQAVDWTEKAIQTDGAVDFQDFEAMFLHCIIYMRQGDIAGIRKTAERIRGIVPDEEDARKYVSARFAFMAGALVRQLMFDEAIAFVSAAKDFDTDNEGLQEFGANIDELLALHGEAQVVEGDEDFIPPIVMMVKCQFAAMVGWEGHDYETFWNESLQSLDLFRPDFTQRALKATKRKCPVFYRINMELIDKLISIADDQVAAFNQCQRATNDSALPNGLRALAEVFTNVVGGYYKHAPEAEFERDWKMAMAIMEQDSVISIRNGLQRIKQQYPKMRATNRELFSSLESSVQSAMGGGTGYSSSGAHANDDACFVGETLILRIDGSSTPIGRMEVGMTVVGVHRAGFKECKVLRVDRHPPRRVLRVETESHAVTVTPNHRFSSDGRWKRAGQLQVGDLVERLVGDDQHRPILEQVTNITPVQRPAPVYNIVVERPCTYIADGFVVHSFGWFPRLRTLLLGLPGLPRLAAPLPEPG